MLPPFLKHASAQKAASEHERASKSNASVEVRHYQKHSHQCKKI